MDLISIRRKYRNIRNIIIAILILVLLIVMLLTIIEINKLTKNKKIYSSYEKQIKQIQELNAEKERQKEEERKARMPKLTEDGKSEVKNIYKSSTKRVFLTFDDGPSQTVTPKILDTLKKENIKATFFMLGSRVELNPEIVKRAYQEGHYLASHGYSHVYSQIYASPQSVIDEYNRSVIAIQNAIGEQGYNPHLFRFPGGYWGGKYANVKNQAERLLEQNDVIHVDWNALISDSAGAKTTEDFISELEKTVPKYNSVVALLHDSGNKIATAKALPTIIKYFKDKGFEFENFYSIIK